VEKGIGSVPELSVASEVAVDATEAAGSSFWRFVFGFAVSSANRAGTIKRVPAIPTINLAADLIGAS
jgi:hypothetical protein